jgi:hypothetical protein
MKRLSISLFALTLALYLGGATAYAQHGHGGGDPAGGRPGIGAPERRAEKGVKPESSEPSSSKKTVSDLLNQNTRLASKIAKLTGMDAQKACAGFRKLGQCVAAAHVAHNLGIGFNTLKAKVTGPNAVSLGQAIHDLNPNVNAKAEAKKAQKAADEDMKGPRS